MSPTRAEQAESTRRAVLATAERLFVTHGFDATSLQLIADTLGVTKAGVYYYFRTKVEILEALLDARIAAMAVMLDAAEKTPGRDDRLEFLVDGFVDQTVRAHRTVAINDPSMRRHERISRTLDDLAERGLHLLFGDRPTIDEQAAFWIVNDLAPVTHRFTDLPDDELRATLKRLCLRMLRG